MPSHKKCPRDFAQRAKMIVDIDVAAEPVPCWPGLVAERQLVIFYRGQAMPSIQQATACTQVLMYLLGHFSPSWVRRLSSQSGPNIKVLR
jgi:hypothetical protein